MVSAVRFNIGHQQNWFIFYFNLSHIYKKIKKNVSFYLYYYFEDFKKILLTKPTHILPSYFPLLVIYCIQFKCPSSSDSN